MSDNKKQDTQQPGDRGVSDHGTRDLGTDKQDDAIGGTVEGVSDHGTRDLGDEGSRGVSDHGTRDLGSANEGDEKTP